MYCSETLELTGKSCSLSTAKLLTNGYFNQGLKIIHPPQVRQNALEFEECDFGYCLRENIHFANRLMLLPRFDILAPEVDGIQDDAETAVQKQNYILNLMTAGRNLKKKIFLTKK